MKPGNNQIYGQIMDKGTNVLINPHATWLGQAINVSSQNFGVGRMAYAQNETSLRRVYVNWFQ
ncbi:MAG: hypothetical protein WCS37_12695 [Chloroflexota bacterium]